MVEAGFNNRDVPWPRGFWEWIWDTGQTRDRLGSADRHMIRPKSWELIGVFLKDDKDCKDVGPFWEAF